MALQKNLGSATETSDKYVYGNFYCSNGTISSLHMNTYLTKALPYGSGAEAIIYMGSSNDSMVDTNNVYQWFFRVSGNASGQHLYFNVKRRSLADTSLGIALYNGTWQNTAAAWAAISDERLKTNIIEISPTECLQKISSLQPKSWNWKNPNLHEGETNIGLIAQDVEKVFPNLVKEGVTKDAEKDLVEDHCKVVNASSVEMIAMLIGSIKDLKARIEQLENK